MSKVTLRQYKDACDIAVHSSQSIAIELSHPKKQIFITQWRTTTIQTGIHVQDIFVGYYLELMVPAKLAEMGVIVLNQYIEPNYRKEIIVILGNIALTEIVINPGLAFCSLIIKQAIFPEKDENLEVITPLKLNRINTTKPRN